MTAIINAGEGLIGSLESSDPAAVLESLAAFKLGMRTPEVGVDFINWISNPKNLTQVHELLSSRLGIPPRLLAIRRINTSRGQRTMLLLQAMEIAIKKVHNL